MVGFLLKIMVKGGNDSVAIFYDLISK